MFFNPNKTNHYINHHRKQIADDFNRKARKYLHLDKDNSAKNKAQEQSAKDFLKRTKSYMNDKKSIRPSDIKK